MRWVIAVVAILVVGYSGCEKEARRLNNTGHAEVKAGNKRAAIEAFAKAVRLKPRVQKYRHDLGRALARAGLWEQSKTELEIALQLDPSNMDTRRLLAFVQRRVQDDYH